MELYLMFGAGIILGMIIGAALAATNNAKDEVELFEFMNK